MQVNSNLAASSPPTKIGNLNLHNIINWQVKCLKYDLSAVPPHNFFLKKLGLIAIIFCLNMQL